MCKDDETVSAFSHFLMNLIQGDTITHSFYPFSLIRSIIQLDSRPFTFCHIAWESEYFWTHFPNRRYVGVTHFLSHIINLWRKIRKMRLNSLTFTIFFLGSRFVCQPFGWIKGKPTTGTSFDKRLTLYLSLNYFPFYLILSHASLKSFSLFSSLHFSLDSRTNSTTNPSHYPSFSLCLSVGIRYLL